MKKVKLGSCSDILISQMGFGCLSLSGFFSQTTDQAATELAHQALNRGINFFDTADVYGMGHNEKLLSVFLKGKRSEVVLATKFGFVKGPDGTITGVSGHPDYLKKACEESLKRLNTDYIDLYYAHRIDPEVPVEETIGAMKRLQEEGKIRSIGLSEANKNNLLRAAQEAPIAALQTEYSLWSVEVEEEILPACQQTNTTLVAYSPLGRGFLTGKVTSHDQLSANDYRATIPRFWPENLPHNLEQLKTLTHMAHAKGCTPAQLALAWLLQQPSPVVPIPGTNKLQYLDQNIAATEVQLTPSEIDQLRAMAHNFKGDRYGSKALNRILEQ